MHRVIRIICYAKNKKEAREKAEEILNENLVRNGEPFDYGTFFDEDSSGSGKNRWGNLPVVALADSKEGKKLIDEGMKFTKDEFIKNVKEVREMINFYSDEELFEENVVDVKKKILESLQDKKDKVSLGISFFKHYCFCLGEYKGTDIYVYDNDGEGIRTTKHLKSTLNKWNSANYKDLKVFVVPVDVHS